MNQDTLNDLEKFLKLLPSDNNWKVDKENLQLTDPLGSTFSLVSEDDVGLVTKTLYLEVIGTLLNHFSELMEVIESLRASEASYKSELDHYRGRSKHLYNRALEDVETIIQATPIYTKSAKDVLNSVIDQMQQLYDVKSVPQKLSIDGS